MTAKVISLLTRKQILEADDLRTEIVDVPEWGGSVAVRTLTGDERDGLEKEMMSFTDQGAPEHMNFDHFRSRFVAASIVDEDGKLIFSPEDVVALSQKSGRALTRVFRVAQTLSGYTNDQVKELTEQLGKGQNGGSGSS